MAGGAQTGGRSEALQAERAEDGRPCGAGTTGTCHGGGEVGCAVGKAAGKEAKTEP